MYIYRLQRDFALPCFAGVMRNAPPEPTVNTSQEKKVDFVSALKWVCQKKVVGSNDLRAYVSTPNQQGFYQNSAGIPLLYYDRSTQMSFHRSSRAQFHTSNEDSWGQLHFTLLSEYIICVYSCIYTYCNIQWLYSLWFSAVVDYSSHVLNGTGSYMVLWYLPQKGCALITNLRQQPFRSWLRPIPRGGAISTFAYLAAGFGF